MYQGQTPQSFKAKNLREIYNSLTDAERDILTDAAKILVMKGQHVHLVNGETFNIKITYPYDMSGTLENWLRRNTDIISQDYDEQVTCIFEAEDENIPDRIRDMTKGTVEPLFLAETVREVPAG